MTQCPFIVQKWHSFKIKIIHELTEDDPDQRIKFYDEIMR